MGSFNFGAFAGGLSDGINQAQKLKLQQDKLEQDKLKAEQDKKFKETERQLKEQKMQKDEQAAIDKENNRVSKLTSELEESMYDDSLTIKQRHNRYNTKAKALGLDVRKTIMTSPEGEDYIVPYTTDQEEMVLSLKADINQWKGDGLAKLDKTGALYNRPNEVAEFIPMNNLRAISTSEYNKKEDAGAKGSDLFKAWKTFNQSVPEGEKPMSLETFKRTKWDKPTANQNINVNISSGETSATTSSEAVKLLGKKGSLTNDEVNKLWSAERNFIADEATTDEKKEYTNVEKSWRTVEELKKTRDLYQKMKDKGYKGGIISDVTKGVMKYVGSGGVLSELTGMTEEKFKEVTGIESGMTSQNMEIIKDLSGLAYSNQQMSMMQKITGDINLVTNEHRINAMNGYIARMHRDTKSLIDDKDRFARKYPHLSWSLNKKVTDKSSDSPKQTNKPARIQDGYRFEWDSEKNKYVNKGKVK